MIAARIDADRIDEALVRSLLVEQFPQWSGLPLRFVERGGNDHRIFRLGDDLSVRLPSAPGYVPQVEKEQTWLPRLAPQLPLPIPEVRGVGRPSERFPRPGPSTAGSRASRRRRSRVEDPVRLAADLAAFLVALRSVDADRRSGPGPAQRLPRRLRSSTGMRRCTTCCAGCTAASATLRAGLWRDALDAPFTGPPVWFHGDVSVNNLLVRDGALAAVIDFGCSAVGDPACDTTILLDAPERRRARVLPREASRWTRRPGRGVGDGRCGKGSS